MRVIGVGEEGRGRRRHQTVVALRGIETPGAFTDRVSAIPAPAVSAVFRPNRRPSLLSLSVHSSLLHLPLPAAAAARPLTTELTDGRRDDSPTHTRTDRRVD